MPAIRSGATATSAVTYSSPAAAPALAWLKNAFERSTPTVLSGLAMRERSKMEGMRFLSSRSVSDIARTFNVHVATIYRLAEVLLTFLNFLGKSCNMLDQSAINL